MATEHSRGEALERPIAVRRRRGTGVIGRSAVIGLSVPPATTFDWVDRLLDLCDRRASGVVSAEEFAREKAKILSS